MAMLVEQFLNTFIFMKPSIIHHNQVLGFKAWNQGVFAPVVEYSVVEILLNVLKRKQHLFIESTNDIRKLFCLPVVAIDTGCTYRCIAMRTNGFSLKAALIHIDYGIALLRKAIKPTPVSRSFYWTRFWMF